MNELERGRTVWGFVAAAVALIGGCTVLGEGLLAEKPTEAELAGPSSGGSGGGGGAPCGGACPEEACCDGACADLTSDPAHCGACGTSCGSLGACCDGGCVDVSTDEEHCGSCGTSCKGTICFGGRCSDMCALPYADCDHNLLTNGCETDLSLDAANCGSCEVACPVGAACGAGVCVCPPGTADCDGSLENGCEVNTASDVGNCGACNAHCAPNEVCSQGDCACAPGFDDCNGVADDGCESPLDSRLNCGACGTQCGLHEVCDGGCICAPGFLDCDGQPGCEAFKVSPTTCGACDVSCAPGEVCGGSGCAIACTGGLTSCGGSCVNLDTDPSHCGDCDVAVGPHQQCVNGSPQCAPGWDDCTAQPGCETPIDADVENCGGCDQKCKPGSVCVQGDCACAAGTPMDCGTSCRVCCDDDDCSDGMGCTTDTCLPGGTGCMNTSCSAGTHCCGQVACFPCCVDPDCPAGDVCLQGTCVPSLQLGLVAYYGLDETGGEREDALGVHTLSEVGTVTAVQGVLGNAAVFSNTSHLVAPDDEALSTGDVAFTIDGWFYLASKGAVRTLVSKWNTTAGQREFLLRYDPIFDRFIFAVSSDGANMTVVTADAYGPPALSTWAYIRAWHDPTADTISIQVDGGPVNSVAHAGGVFDSTSELRIGATAGGSLHHGRADAVGYWKRLLTPAEASARFNGGSGLDYPF